MSEKEGHIFTFENRRFRLVAILLLLAGVVTVLVTFRGILLPFILAMVVCYVMEPLVRRMHAMPIFGLFLPRWTCVLILYAIFFSIVASFVIFVVPPMYRDLARDGERRWQMIKHDIEDWLAKDRTKKEVRIDSADGAKDPPKEEAKNGDGAPNGDLAAMPAKELKTRDLRLTDVDGEVVWVPRRLGLVRVQVYDKDQIETYLEFRNKGAAPPDPDYTFPVLVVSNWEVDSTREGWAPPPLEPGTRTAQVNTGEHLTIRQSGYAVEGALVEVVYPAEGDSPENRDVHPSHQFIQDENEAKGTEGFLDKIERFIRPQVKTAWAWLSKQAEIQARQSVEYIGPVVTAVFKTVFTIILVLMIAAFISIDLRRVQQFVFELVAPSYRPQFEELMAGFDRGLSGVIRGQLLICLVNGTLSGIGLWFFDVPFWYVLTLIVTIFTLIPIFGTIISSVPCVLFATVEGGLGTGVNVLLWICAIHALEAYYLNPRIIGHSAHMHPVLVVFALVGGEYAYGLLGALLGVPVVSMLQNIFLFMHRRLVAASEEEAKRIGVTILKQPRSIEEENLARERAIAQKKREKTQRLKEGEVPHGEPESASGSAPPPEGDR